jgi:Domain of unknown function (DUF4177)
VAEYKWVEIEQSSNQVDPAEMTEALNAHAAEGWRVHTVYLRNYDVHALLER